MMGKLKKRGVSVLLSVLFLELAAGANVFAEGESQLSAAESGCPAAGSVGADASFSIKEELLISGELPASTAEKADSGPSGSAAGDGRTESAAPSPEDASVLEEPSAGTEDSAEGKTDPLTGKERLSEEKTDPPAGTENADEEKTDPPAERGSRTEDAREKSSDLWEPEAEPPKTRSGIKAELSVLFSEDWSNRVDREGARTAYYGLQNGVDAPKAAKVKLVLEARGGMPARLPDVLVKKGDRTFGIVPGKKDGKWEFLSCTEWKTVGNTFVSELTIRPEKENSEADGVYTFALADAEEDICLEWIYKTNPENAVIIDTTRPTVVYSVDQRANEYDEAGYYKVNFTESYVVKERNFDESRMKVSLRKAASLEKTDRTGTKKGPNTREEGVYTYCWTRTDEAVYRTEFSGTDLAGNQARFVPGRNVLKSDREAIEAANGRNGKAGSHILKTGAKVLDRTPPRVTCAGTRLSDTHIYKEEKQNISYFNKDIRMTFSVDEEHFDPERIDRFYARIDGKPDAGWETAAEGRAAREGKAVIRGPSEEEQENGRYVYSALVKAAADGRNDGRYTFTIRGTDKAGNGLYVINGEDSAGIDPAQTRAQKNAGIYTTGIKVMDRTAPAAVCSGRYLAPKYIYEGDADYFSKDIRIYFVVDERNFIENRMSLSSNDGRALLYEPVFREDGKIVYQGFVAAEKKSHANDGRYTFTLRGTDKAGNRLTVTKGKNYTTVNDPAQTRPGVYTTGVKVMDTTAPAVTYTAAKPEAAHVYAGDADYFNRDLSVTFTVSELNFAERKTSLSYRLAEAGETAGAVIRGPRASMNALHEYTALVKAEAKGVNDGRYVFVFQGEDKAGNGIRVKRGENTTENDPPQMESQRILGTYRTGVKVMDTTPPVYTLTEMTEPADAEENTDGIRAYYGRSFSGKELRVSFRVDDANLDGRKVAAGLAYRNGERYAETDPVWTDPFGGGQSGAKSSRERNKTKVCTQCVPVRSGKDGTYRAVIAGEDMAGNRLAMSEEEERRNRFARAYARTEAYEGGGRFRTMIKVIDTLVPAGHITIRSPRDTVYYDAELLKDAGLQVRASEPYRSERQAEGTVSVYGGRDGRSEHSPVKIEYSVISSVEGLSRSGVIREYAYENKADFSCGEPQVFFLKITLTDRAGNSTGAVETNKIYLDVQDPEIPGDRLAPVILVSATAKTDSHGALGDPLFNGPVPIHILVTDPGRPRNHAFLGSRSAGLDEVYYTISVDGQEGSPVHLRKAGRKRFGEEADGRAVYEEPELVYEIEDTRTVDGSLNSNNLALTVYAKDNAGNMRFARYGFGIDTTPPSIRVTYDNNDVKNGRYFRADRTATVVVTERNFDESGIRVETNGGSSSGWVYANHGGNGDQDTWTKTVLFAEDGDFTFDVSGMDLLGNPAGSVIFEGAAAKAFTVDKTAPEISLRFDRNNGKEGRYYRETRRARLRIREKNLRPSDITVEGVQGTTAPGNASAGSWQGGGEERYLEISFAEDGDYRLLVSAVDLAGNEAKTVSSELFTIDKTKPTLKFDGETVRDQAAYGDNFEPGILYGDTNFDPEGVVFTMRGNRGSVFGTPIRSEDAFGGSGRFPNLENIKENDDIYTLFASVTDRAGNVSEEELVCSVNRFGSTWNYNEDAGTEEAVDAFFIKEERELYLREINVTKTRLESVSLQHEGSYRTLSEGEDFAVIDQSVENGWSARVYKFPAGIFAEEGYYSIAVHTVDEAGNQNCNTAARLDDGQTAATPLEFTLDKTSPYAMIANLDTSVEQYDQESLLVELTAEDDLSGLVRVRVQLEKRSGAETVFDKENHFRDPETGEYVDELREYLDENKGRVVFEIPGDSDPQTLRVISWDAAGNVSESAANGTAVKEEGEVLLKNILVTTNVASRVFHNKPLFIAAVFAICLAPAGILMLIMRIRRRNFFRH